VLVKMPDCYFTDTWMCLLSSKKTQSSPASTARRPNRPNFVPSMGAVVRSAARAPCARVIHRLPCDEARSRYHRAMAGFFRALRAGLSGEPDVTEGDRFTAAGKVITCSHCAHDRFAEGHAQLNTAGMAE
jgi:hypothetical protein